MYLLEWKMNILLQHGQIDRYIVLLQSLRCLHFKYTLNQHKFLVASTIE